MINNLKALEREDRYSTSHIQPPVVPPPSTIPPSTATPTVTPPVSVPAQPPKSQPYSGQSSDTKWTSPMFQAPAAETRPPIIPWEDRLKPLFPFDLGQMPPRPSPGYTASPPATQPIADRTLKKEADWYKTVENVLNSYANGMLDSSGRPLQDWARDKADGLTAEYNLQKKAEIDYANNHYYTTNDQALNNLRTDAKLSDKLEKAMALDKELQQVGIMLTGVPGDDGRAAAEAYDTLTDKYPWGLRGSLGGFAGELETRLRTELNGLVQELEQAGYDYESISSYLEKQENLALAAQRQAQDVTYAQAHPVGASAQTLLLAPFRGLDYLGMVVDNLGHSDPTDLDSYIPPDSSQMQITNYIDTVRGTVSTQLEKNTDWEVMGENVAAFCYNTGMGVLDSGIQIAAFGTASVYFMGASAAAEQSKEIIDRGGSANQAMLGGLAAGATEVLLEKIPVSQLLSIRDVKTAKSMLGATVKQMGLEASDEMLSEIAYLITDAIVMEDNSYFCSKTAQYELLGLSPEAAQREALKDCVGRVALAGGTGAVEGGLKGGAWAAGSYAGGKISSQLPNPWTSGSVDSFDPMDYDGNTHSEIPDLDPRPYLHSRPPYAKGQVDTVWDLGGAKTGGVVIDPSGAVIVWDRTRPRNGQWDMGHIPTQKYSTIHQQYVDGFMTPEQFLQWYQEPANYRPELPSTNRSHRYE